MTDRKSPHDLQYIYHADTTSLGDSTIWGVVPGAQGNVVMPDGSAGVGSVEATLAGLVRFTFEVRVPLLTVAAGMIYYDIFQWGGSARPRATPNGAKLGDNFTITEIMLAGGANPTYADSSYAAEAAPSSGGAGELTIAFVMYTPTGGVNETFWSTTGTMGELWNTAGPINSARVATDGRAGSSSLPRTMFPDRAAVLDGPRILRIGLQAAVATINSGVFKVAILGMEF